MRRKEKSRNFRCVSRFVRETDGVMTMLALFFFVMLVGIGGLAVDIGRVYALRGQMVAYVDQVALASAAELDGQSGAIDRAFRVALGDADGGPLVLTSYNFAQTNDLALYNVIFLSQIASGPGPTPETGDKPYVLCTYQDGAWAPANCNTDKTNNETAQFVAVTSTPLSVSYFVLPIANFFLGPNAMTDIATLKMQATAGYKQEVCDLTPLMICNPSEPAGNTDTKLPYTPTIGQQVLMKASGSTSGGSAAWVPGDFGLLSEPQADAGGNCKGNQHGAGFITCMLALVDPLSQCVGSDVSVKPGQSEATTDGFNARFDVYVQAAGKFSGNSLFAPSVDVTKGMVGQGGSKCPNKFNAATTSVPLPRDTNLKTDTTGNVRFGTGVSATDMQTYWSTNHPGTTMPSVLQTDCQSGSGVPCRYDVYRYEIDNNLIPNIKSGENGGPTCTTPGVNNSFRDRRTLIMAVINCQAAGLKGNSNGSNVPVVAFVKMFMTEPAGLQEDTTGKVTGFAPAPNIYGEVVSLVEPGDQSGVLHDIPVLYR